MPDPSYRDVNSHRPPARRLRVPQQVGLAAVAAAIAGVAFLCAQTGGVASPFTALYALIATGAVLALTRSQALVAVVAIAVAIIAPAALGIGRTLDDEVLRITVRVIGVAAIAYLCHRARERTRALVAQAERLAHQDPLTGVANRRGLEQRASAELARARRRRGRVALLLVDLDEFRDINARHGGQVGDEVLRRVALGLTTTVRGEDFVARLGGDRFIVLLPDASDDEARRVAARVAAAAERVVPGPEPDRILTATVGIAASPDHGAVLADLLESADQAVRRVRRARRREARQTLESFTSLPAIELAAGLEAAPVAGPPSWPLRRGLVPAGWALTIAVAAWFAGPLVAPALAVRFALEGVLVLAIVIAGASVARRVKGRERIGWALIAAGPVIACVRPIGAAGALVIGTGILVVSSGRWWRDRWRVLDGAGMLLILLALTGVFVGRPLLDRTTDPLELATGFANAAVLALAIATAVVVACYTSVRRRPDVWLLATGFGVSAVAAFPYVASGAGPALNSPWELAQPVAGALLLGGALLRLATAPAPVDDTEVNPRGIHSSVVRNLLCGVLMVAVTLQEGAVPAAVVPVLLATLLLNHLRGRLVERDNRRLLELARRHREDLVAQYRASLLALTATLEARDGYTGRHGQETVALAGEVARELALDDELVAEVETAALLHDIGKIGTPNEVLLKPGKLTDEEWQIMREHPVIGERILRTVPGLERVARAVRHEHERWDGGGYPDGLAGEDIPLASRIVLVCDAFHAMTSDRPYRLAMSQEGAVAELRRCAGTQFDPAVAHALLALLGRGWRAPEADDGGSEPTVELGAADAHHAAS